VAHIRRDLRIRTLSRWPLSPGNVGLELFENAASPDIPPEYTKVDSNRAASLRSVLSKESP
jgi:hypothetical protein